MRYFLAIVVLAVGTLNIAGQRIAVITPLDSETDRAYADALADALKQKGMRLVDRALAFSVFEAAGLNSPFNLSTVESKNLAAAIGCEYLIIVRSEVLRRASFNRPDYFEAYVAAYLVSGRSGRLVNWKLASQEASTSTAALQKLVASTGTHAADIVASLRSNGADERAPTATAAIEEVPDENSPAAKGLRPPVPYRRIKPVYTSQAAFYSVPATVDALVDISATGEVIRTEIVRWAGFGLDESVTDTIKKMNWRPAMRNGVPLAMRVLLRYNFTKVETDE